MVISKKTIIKHFSGGPCFPGGRSNCLFLYKPIELVIFQGEGVRAHFPPLELCMKVYVRTVIESEA